MKRSERFGAWWAHAFATRADEAPLDPGDVALLQRLGSIVVRRRMAAPALLLLECVRPLGFLGSQLLHFVRPLATLAFAAGEYERLARLLERRAGIDLLVRAIAEQETKAHE